MTSILTARICNLGVAPDYRIGVELDRGILDVAATAAVLDLPAPRDVDDLLQNERGAELQALLDAVALRQADAVFVPAEAVRFAPLVTRPKKIICVGFNYREHAEETGTPIPKASPLFCKFRNTRPRCATSRSTRSRRKTRSAC